jgi:hypothetical protein
MSQRAAGAFVVAAAVLVAAHARAQSRPQSDPDMAELAAYRLNVATLQKVIVATRTFEQALENDPKYAPYIAAQKELKAFEEKDNPTPADQQRIVALERQLERMPDALSGGGDASSLAEMERKIGAMPHMDDAFAKAGISAREYAKFNLTILQAGFLAGMKKAGQLRQLPPGVSMENVQFVVDHEKEIAGLGAQATGK